MVLPPDFTSEDLNLRESKPHLDLQSEVQMPRLVADGLSYEQIQELKTTAGTPNGGDGRLGIDARKVILQEEVPQLVLQPRCTEDAPLSLTSC